MDDSNKMKNIFIADSGASCHMIHSDKGMFDTKNIKDEITIGNGASVLATKIGKLRATVETIDGEKKNIILTNVKHVPALAPYNLFSITQALTQGCSIGNEGKKIYLIKDKFKLMFDQEIKTKSGYVVGVKIIPRIENNDNTALPAITKNKPIQHDILHNTLGHISDESMRKTAKYYNLQLTKKETSCGDCLLAKARQKNIPKLNENRSKIPGQRLFFDVSSIKNKSFGGSKFWLMIMDDATDYIWSYFLKNKSEVPTYIIELIKELKEKHNIKVEILHCDNAGENLMTERKCKEEGLGIKMEYTAPNTPQQNGRIERKFPTLYGRVRAMLNAAQVSKTLRKGLWAECAKTATLLENICVGVHEDQPSYTKFFKKDNDTLWHMHPFGEIAIVTKKKKLQSKLENTGIPAICLGHADNHAKDVYRMLNLNTYKVIITRDIRWMNMTYKHYMNKQGEQIDDDEEEDFKFRKEEKNEENNNDDNNINYNGYDEDDESIPPTRPRTVTPGTTEYPTRNQRNRINKKLITEMKRLSTSYNDKADQVLNSIHQNELNLDTIFEQEQNDQQNIDYQSGREPDDEEEIDGDERSINENAAIMIDKQLNELALLMREELLERKQKDNTLILPMSTEKEPTTFQEAWNHPNINQRMKWREAIKKEFKKMNERKVWRKIKRNQMEKGRRCIKNKWIFKIKRNGTYRARLVACGYSQIPGVDFTESFAPVIHDITWRILLIIKMLWDLDTKIVDVETAFLWGDLEEKIYMNCPEGMPHFDDECLLLLQTIYGLVQSARQYYKKFIKKLRKRGFTGGIIDPCLMMRKDQNGIVFIAIWVDDSLMMGHTKAIEAAIKDIEEEGFKLSVEGTLQDYLSCEITFAKNKRKAWIHQPHLIKKLEEKFGNLVNHLPTYNTPGTPGANISRNVEVKIDEEKQRIYRSGVGLLLYLVKHTRPDIANSVRELSKVLDGASPAAYKELLRVIKYVLDTKDLALKIEPITSKNNIWTLMAFSDSDFASDRETRISITGFILYLMGVIISWKTKKQDGVTLSSSEAEYVALSEASKEVKFVYQILTSMGIKIELPIIIRVDNIGAIFMAENINTSQKTKHVDIRYRYINEFIEDGFIKIIFVRTADNDADIFTKNLTKDLHHKHANKFLENKQKMNGET